MEYQEEAEISPLPRTPYLKLVVEDQYQLEALTCLEYMLTQVLQRMGKGTISQAQRGFNRNMLVFARRKPL